MELNNFKPKSFWERPEGKTGMGFLAAGVLGGGYLLYLALPTILALATNLLFLAVILLALAAIVYVILDPKARNLMGYMYQSVMRFITGVFIQIDPIGVLKSYISDLQGNLGKMNKQIGLLKGQMRKLATIIKENESKIKSNLHLASKAREKDKQNIMILKSRKAGRLQESNMKLGDLYNKMEIMYRVLVKMYENSEILLEDVKDQVQVKEQERKAIRASHSAMKSARNIISGKSDQRKMFDMALEAIADDVNNKIGEMERFMDLSTNFMDSVDLQNGVFEEEGLKMLEKWEKEGVSLILGSEKDLLVNKGNSNEQIDLDAPINKGKKDPGNQYSELFNF